MEEVSRIAGQIRERWPETRIVLRGDSGFCRDDLIVWCEDNEVDFVFGLARNAQLHNRIVRQMRCSRSRSFKSGAVVLRPLPTHGRQLGPDASRGRQGGRVAGAAGRQSLVRRRQPGLRPGRDARPVRAVVTMNG